MHRSDNDNEPASAEIHEYVARETERIAAMVAALGGYGAHALGVTRSGTMVEGVLKPAAAAHALPHIMAPDGLYEVVRVCAARSEAYPERAVTVAVDARGAIVAAAEGDDILATSCVRMLAARVIDGTPRAAPRAVRKATRLKLARIHWSGPLPEAGDQRAAEIARATLIGEQRAGG